MQYVISGAKVCGKVYGDKLTVDDILSAGGSVEHLLASGNIKESTSSPKATKEVKEEAVQQVVETPPVFNLDNEQGEKQPWQD